MRRASAVRAMVRLGMARESPLRARWKSSPRSGGKSTGHQRADLDWRNRRPGGTDKDFGKVRATIGDTVNFFYDQAQVSFTISLINSATGLGEYVGRVITIIIISAITPIHIMSPIPVLAYLTVNILILLLKINRAR